MLKTIQNFLLAVIIILCLPSFFACQSENKGQSNEQLDINKERGDNFYGIKSGVVKYDVKGAYNDKQETLYFEDWGDTEARFVETTHFFPGTKNISGQTSRIELRKNGYLYNLDLDARKGTKTKMPPREPRFSFEELLFRLGSAEKVTAYLAGRNIIMLGEKENILNYPCQVIRVSTSQTSYNQICFYEGVVLKNTSYINAGNNSFTNVKQAVAFEPNAQIDASIFEVPDDFPEDAITEIENMLAK